MITRPLKLQDVDYVRQQVDKYFQDRKDNEEVRELKNGDKRIYRKPPSIFGLCEYLGISTDAFDDYIRQENEAYKAIPEISGILAHAKQLIIEELYEGVALGYWNERLVLAQLAKFGVLTNEEKHDIVIKIDGKDSWSE